MRQIYLLVLALGIQLSCNSAVVAQEEQAEEILLKGKVTDAEGHPVGGAKIVIHNEDKNLDTTGKSDGEGNFEIEHDKCSTLSFDVFPSGKSGLTTSHYSHVAGESTKHFIVQLHRGFRVSGRVLAGGQGIKGLEINVIGQDDANSSRGTVHGGGNTKTKAKGEYLLMLTPGKKTVQIKNELYSNLSPVYQHEFTITGDTRLPDMTLPLLK